MCSWCADVYGVDSVLLCSATYVFQIMFYNLSFDFFYHGLLSFDLQGLIPGSNKFMSNFLQNRVCPLSQSEFIIKEKTASSSGLSSICVLLIFSFDDCQYIIINMSNWLIQIV